MSHAFATFLLMNNYFHDVATAMLLACAIVLRTIERAEISGGDRYGDDYAASMKRGVMRLAWFSVAWVVVSGTIRIVTIGAFEWRNFAEKGLLSGLIAKYALALVMMAVGAVFLTRISRRDRRKGR